MKCETFHLRADGDFIAFDSQSLMKMRTKLVVTYFLIIAKVSRGVFSQNMCAMR